MELSWLIEPFATWDAVLVAKWYGAIVITTIALAYLHEAMGVEFGVEAKLKQIPGGFLIMAIGFIMPALEELIFRGIPAYFNMGLTAMIAGTVIWALLHRKRVLIIAPMGVLFLKLWLSGFWIEAIAIHALHNLFLVGLFLAKKDAEDIENGEYDELFEQYADEQTTTIKGQNAEITITTEL